MNVLITNSQEVQAYTVARCLRPDAKKIVVTEGGDSVGSTGFRGMAAYSRFVDARYTVPHFAGDWLAGRLAPENTDAEEAYIRRIEEICRLERIDVLFPSLDPEVYLFAKNKKRLASQGVVAVVPNADVIRIPMDKALQIRAAQRVGFPCPRTFFPESVADLESIKARTSPPWIVKPRFTAHGAHMVFVEDVAGLEAAYLQVNARQPSPIIQEFIPGALRRNYYVTVGRDGQILSLLSPEIVRTFKSGYRVACLTAISSSTGPLMEELRAFLHELGVWGGYTIQTKIDPRDGTPKFLEINSRFGQHLWWRTELGVNEPSICLQLARGGSPAGNFLFREGVLLLDPYRDLAYVYNTLAEAFFGAISRLTGSGGAASESVDDPELPGVFATLRNFRRDYFNRRPKVLCPEVGNILADPYPCLRAFWFKFGGMTAGYFKRLSSATMRRIGGAFTRRAVGTS